MPIFNKKEPFLLFIGDIFVFVFSLWLSVWLRTADVPGWGDFSPYIIPFAIVFLVWALVFFIAGLYDKYTTLLKDRMPTRLLNAQIANSVIVIIFFYLIPYFGITPKTILFIDLVISFVLIYVWRLYSDVVFSVKRKIPAIIIGSGKEMEDLLQEVNKNERLAFSFVKSFDLNQSSGIELIDTIVKTVETEHVRLIVADMKDERIEPVLSHFYNLIFSGIRFMNIDEIYEHVFDRIPVTLLQYHWFFENITFERAIVFDTVKRAGDVLAGFLIGLVTLILLPFVALAIKLEDGGKIFFIQDRIGKNNKIIHTVKFRSMSQTQKEKITKVGLFLRKTRIDELPQSWNLLTGELSLIGPRPETPALVKAYEAEIPYYNVRHLIKPGLSGWAQVYQENPPKYGVDFNNTKDKLSYDLYYIKNRSLMIDLHITLKTIKDLLSRRGK